jgi:hypothetical protein
MDAIATQYGVRKERIQEIVAAGVDLRDRRAVRAALATQGTQADRSPTGDPELERAKAKIEETATKASPGPTTPPPGHPRRRLQRGGISSICWNRLETDCLEEVKVEPGRTNRKF